jgi:hypothetical protein
MATAAIAIRSKTAREWQPVFLPNEWGERFGQRDVVVGAPVLSSPTIDAESLKTFAIWSTLSSTLSEVANNVARVFYNNAQIASSAKLSVMEIRTFNHNSFAYDSIPMKPAYTIKAKLRWLPRPKPMAVIDE